MTDTIANLRAFAPDEIINDVLQGDEAPTADNVELDTQESTAQAWVSAPRAAELIGLPVSAIRTGLKTGEIPVRHIKIGNRLYVNVASIEEFNRA